MVFFNGISFSKEKIHLLRKNIKEGNKVKKINFLILSFILLLSVSAFAQTPELHDIPDIVIGDYEDNSFTIDRNFFRFPDAFLFDNYVVDSDTPVSSLKWSFTGGDGTIEINGLGPETSGNYLNPINDLRTTPTASFRNIAWSPKPDQQLYPAPPSTDAETKITFYASDGTNADSQQITVRTKDNQEDGYVFNIAPTFFEPWDVQDRWRCYASGTNEAPSTIASYSTANKWITCKYPVYPLPSPGFFQWLKLNPNGIGVEPSIIYQPNHIYVMRTKMSADSDDTVPQIRLRTQSIDNVWTACGVYGDFNDPVQQGAAKKTPKNFYMVWEPQGTIENAFVAVDIYSGVENTGEVYVDEVAVYRVPLMTGLSPITTEKTITDFSSWSKIGDNITISSGNVSYADSSTWSTAGQYVSFTTPMTADKVYRIKYSLAKTGSGYTDQIRLRSSDTINGAYSQYFVYNDTNDASKHLSAVPQVFSHYHWAANGRSIYPVGDIGAFCDTIHTLSPAATLVLTQVVIEKITIPPLKY